MLSFTLSGIDCLAIFTVLASQCRHAVAQSSSNYFIQPPPMMSGTAGDYSQDTVYNVGDVLNLEFDTSYDAVDIRLWQDGNTNSVFITQDHDTSSCTECDWPWTVSLENYDTDNGDAFFFCIYQAGENSPFLSRYFNISDNTSAAPTTVTSVVPTQGQFFPSLERT